MKTEFFVDYDLFDTTALQDAVVSSESNSQFADIVLMEENVLAPNYMTLEKNFSVLDGNMQEFPDEPDNLVYFSSEQSGADGTFANKQSVFVQFSENHASVGITLHFLPDYPVELEIYWYDISGNLKSKKTFFPNQIDYFCQNQVEGYGAIEIVFIRAIPLRNVKLQYIEYGTTLTFENDIIKTGKIVNEIDPISDKIKTDKLTFDFLDEKEEFNIGNIDGLHKVFQKNQKMHPYETLNGNKIPLGTFFLDENSTTKNLSKISAIDYKGMLANAIFYDGDMYDGVLAGEIIGKIMEAAGISDYIIDKDTANTLLYGTLKIQTCQKALREVLFACMSSINTSRQNGIEIYKQNRSVSGTITREKKFSTTLKTDGYVSDINVKYKTWFLEETESEIAKGTYGGETNVIQLSSPAANMRSNIGSIIKQTPYYVVLEISSYAQFEVIITGQKYVEEEFAALSSATHVKAGQTRTTKTFSGTLLNYERAKMVADNILNYYQLQQIIQTKQLAENEKAGDWVEIENSIKGYGNFVASIESLSIDLTGGYIATAKYRGYYKLLSNYYYADNELYSGEDVGII